MSLFAVLALPVCYIFHLYVLYRYLVPREGHRKSLLLCFTTVFFLQIFTRICLLSDLPWVSEYNIPKLLTVLMVFLLVFWGGLCIHGGWAQIGLYCIATEIVFAVYERLYWLAWGYYTQATAEEIMLRSQMLKLDLATGIELILEAALAALFLIPARKLRKYPVGRVKAVKAAVTVYLILGCISSATRTGFENESRNSLYIVLVVDSFMFFFAVMTILRKMERESRHLLQLRQYAFAAQAEALDMQRQEIRRFRHDVSRHLDAMSYLMQTRPKLKEDPSFLQYQKELEQYRTAFKQGYYCNSDEFNTGISQLDKYCAAHLIPAAITLRRLQFFGWERDEQLLFGTLIYNLLISDRADQLAGVQISGDSLQGQSIVRIEAEYRLEEVPDTDDTTDLRHKSMTRDYCYEEMEKILSRHKGSCVEQKTEQERSYTFLWENET